jgi:dynein heavy chain 1
MKRIGDVLGKDWEQHMEGRKLKEDGDAFRKKLDTQQIFNSWLNRIADAKEFEVKGMLLAVEQGQGGAARDALNLRVAFDAQIITLFKEVRNLEWLGFRVPYTVKMMADEAKEKYPLAMSLQATLRTYWQACVMEAEQPSISVLLASFKLDVHQEIEAAFKNRQIKWEVMDSEKGLTSYVTGLATKVSAYHDKVDDVLSRDSAIRQDLSTLAKCPYEAGALSEPLSHIQKLIDEMNLAGYRNLEAWVAELDKEVEALLVSRLHAAIDSWVTTFNAQADGGGGDVPAGVVQLELESTTHQVLLHNQSMYLEPPLEQARARWVQLLHTCVDAVCGLQRLDAARYDEGLQLHSGSTALETKSRTFSSVLQQLPPGTLAAAYGAIEGQLVNVNKYVQTWLQYQSLWDMDMGAIEERLGDELSLWQQLVLEIKTERNTLDAGVAVKTFGPLVIDYSTVQANVNMKYDVWSREVLQRYGQLLDEKLREFLSTIGAKRKQLEEQTLEASDTTEVVALVTLIQNLRRQIMSWGQLMEQFVAGEKLLQKQRYSFPTDWLEVSQVEGEWAALQQILRRKSEKMEQSMDGLQAKIMSQASMVDTKVKEIEAEWQQNKPLHGSTKHSAAIETLNLFEGRLNRVREQADQIVDAKEALELTGGDGGGSTGDLEDIKEEMEALRDVWSSLTTPHEKLDELKETLWTATVPRKVRKLLDELLAELKAMPNRIRQYEAFEYLQNLARGYRNSTALVTEMKTDALKDRHWKDMLGRKVLNIAVPFTQLTLGNLYDAGLQKHEVGVRDVIRTAQGEMALEEFLRQVKEQWTDYELDLANYQNRCRLVRGWGELFEKVDEHLSSLASMAHSPYYQVFADEAGTWTDRLTQLRVIFDVWIDVQRRWVYLQGIFFGSADIKQQLPKEFGRFKTIDTEFVGLMRKVSYKPHILEVVAIPNLQRTLERQDDLLQKIQKALGEYLERQRQAFSRFYFVGDEDLLEIIGNGADPMKIQRHFSKMFAGVVSVKLQDEVGYCSIAYYLYCAAN